MKTPTRKLAEFAIDNRKVCEICIIYPNGIGCPFKFPGSEDCISQLITWAESERR